MDRAPARRTSKPVALPPLLRSDADMSNAPPTAISTAESLSHRNCSSPMAMAKMDPNTGWKRVVLTVQRVCVVVDIARVVVPVVQLKVERALAHVC